MTAGDVNWRPSASLEVLERRAHMLGLARNFFAVRSILEVETPVLMRSGITDPHIANLTTRLAARSDRPYYLQTSPEFAMKRLLAAGAADIYQICKVFRDHEIGRIHQPEFTMVEWYRHGIALEEIITETCAFIIEIGETPSVGIDQYRYRDIFLTTCDIDPLVADLGHLADCAERMIDALTPDLRQRIGTDRNAWLDLLMSHVIMPGLATDRLSVIHHFPADQAALARLDPAEPKVAERFEIIFAGIELANGYRELTDVIEQRHRFNTDLQLRHAAGLPAMKPDQALLGALDHGLPECSGVAIGFDRLVMTACGLSHIDQVISFTQ
ncbi:MAG: EF-P lysine aminoacylase EpmA [Gammaproteobacteria bacterium]|nr:EF-P lysine aminoacylase EpmA [Gammaproteobacteria bacterium]